MAKKSVLSKSFSWVLSIVMFLSIFQGLALPVFAEESEVSLPTSEVSLPQSEVSTPESDILAPESDVSSPNSDVSAPTSDISSPQSEVSSLEEEAEPMGAPDTITVTPSTATVVLGATQQFAVAVTGAEASDTVTWAVEGSTDAATTISAAGLLTVGAIEGAETLTVKATSTEDIGKFATATVTVADLPFSMALSRNDLLLHYVFDTNDKGASNNIIKDYSPKGNDSVINGNPTASQWSSTGFTFNNSTTANNNIKIPTSAGLVNPRMTFVFALTRTGTIGTGSVFSGKSGWASNGLWMNTNNCYISHNGSSGTTTLGAVNTVFPQNSRVEVGYSVDARTSAATGLIMMNGVKSATPVGTAQITPLTGSALDYYSIGLNTWGDEPLRNAKFDKYMIFNRDLTEGELREVYDGRLDPYKSALNDEVVSAMGRNTSYYTVASMATMRSARRAAIAVLKNRTATAEQVNSALASLKLTVQGLVAVANIVTSVTVTPATTSMNVATTKQFTAEVATGEASIPKTLVWSVDSEKSTITQDGLLSIPLDEDKTQLTVTATSTIDYAVSGTATVTVTQDPAIVSIAVSPKTADVLKGKTQAFAAALVTVGGASDTVTWSVNGTASSIDASGVLTVGAGETSNSLTVTATSTVDPTKTDTATVTTYAISGVTITPPAKTPQKGRASIFTATLAGTNIPTTARAVTWELENAIHTDTKINAFGSLYISPDETATQLTVKATSVKDTTKFVTLVVSVAEYMEDALVPNNGYYNTFTRAPGTGTAYGNNVAVPEWDSNGTWRTITGQTAAPVMSTNSGLNWSTAQAGSTGMIYTPAEAVYLGGWTTYYHVTDSSTPGGEIATYSGGDFADIDYTVGMRINSGATTGAVVFRYQDYQNYYYVRQTVGSGVTVGKVVNGVDTTLHTANTAVAASTWYNLRVIVTGDKVTVRRYTYAYWRVANESAITNIFTNVTLDAANTFKQGRCGLWAPGGNTNVHFNLVGIGSRDFNYTIANDTFTLTSGSQGHLKSLKINGGNLTNMDFMSNEDQIRVEMGLNKYMGELKFKYQVGGAAAKTANTGTSGDIRGMSLDAQNKKIAIDYSGVSANATGIRDFAVQEAYSLATDPVSGDYVQFDIHIKNTGAESIEFQDIALPISWNAHWQADSPYENYATHASNYVSYNSSYISLERASGGGDKLVFIPDSSTDAKLEYRRYFSTADYYMNMPEEFYIYSKGIAANTTNNFDQGYLPNTSLTMAAGEEKTLSFRIFKTSDYVGINDILYQQGLIAPSVNPGMVAPIDNVAEVDLRTLKNIEDVVDLTPAPPAPAVYNAATKATITKNLEKSDSEHHIYNIKFNKLGRNDITVIYDGGKKSVLQFWVTEALGDAIQRRADFLIDNLWVSDARRAEIMASEPSTSNLYKYVDKHPYSFLEMDNTTGVASTHSGNSFYCSNSDYEQYYDGPDFLAAKNIYYPKQREIDALDKYLIDHVWKDQIYHFDHADVGYMYTGCCQQVGFGSSVWTRITRIYNYPRIYNQFFSMYQIAKRYPDMNLREDAVWYLQVAAIVAKRGIALSGATGVMGEQTLVDMIAALRAEGETAYADSIQAASVTKGNNMAAQSYPFGSEFSVDNTGEEGAYFNIKNFSTAANKQTKMKQTVDKSLAWIGKTPVWYLQTTGRPAGNDWWMFQYAVGLQAKAYSDYYFNYASSQDAQDIWRMVYPAKMSPFVHIQSGQPELNVGPTTGALANSNQAVDGKGVKGTVWGNIMPTRPYNWNIGFPYSTSAEADISLWSGLQLLSSDIVPNDPAFGLTGYGCEVTDGTTTYDVIPKDGLFRRLNVVGDRFQMELMQDEYIAAKLNKDYKAISLTLKNALGTAHEGNVSLRGLAVGEYNVRVNGVIQGVVEVTNSDAKTNFTYNVDTATAQTLKIVLASEDEEGGDEDYIISVSVAPTTANVLKGKTQTFTETVRMENTGNTLAGTVVWSVTGGVSLDTKIENGVLTVGADETATTLTVKVASTDDPTKSATAAVSVYSITDVAITPASPEVQKGKTLTLTGAVTHVNAPASLRGVDWTVQGGGEGTSISSAGVLTVAASETASSLTVKAAAKGDATKFTTVLVTLTERIPVSKSDLRLYYAFDGTGTSGALNDYSTYGNNTTINGTVSASSWTGDGFAFASGNNIKLASTVQLVNPEMTIVFKMKRTANMAEHSLFWGKNASGWASNGMFINTANGLTIYHDGTATPFDLETTANELFPLNEWVEVAYSIDTTSSPAVGVLMVNGVKRNVTIPADAKLTNPATPFNSIGLAGYDNEPLTGATMSKYMIFDRALTEQELVAVYNGSITPYDAATNIINVPNVATTGVDLALTGTVEPAYATNKTIVWSIDDAGTTGASIVEGNKLSTTAAGTVVVTATIANGATETTDYTKNFTITVSAQTHAILPVIGTSPADMVLPAGQAATLTVAATTADSGVLSYQWYSNTTKSTTGGSLISGATSASYTAPTSSAGTTFYYVVVTNTNASATGTKAQTVTSEVATVTVQTPVVAVMGVTLSETTKTLAVGSSAVLTATVAPANATNATITWSSSSAAATVDSNGKVTAQQAGTAVITVTTQDGGKTATCTITIPSPIVKVAAVTLNMASKDLKAGKTVQLKATVNPANATDKAVTWKSSNTKIASVSKTGLVKALKEGTATITATASGKQAKTILRVSSKYAPVSSVKLSAHKLSLNAKGSYALTATIAPKNASNTKVAWASSNTGVATVSARGVIAAKGVGVATITATTNESGKVAKCTVTVKAAVTKLTLDKTKATLAPGKSITLKATVAPKEALQTTMTWKSNNTKVATVDSKGKIKALKKGSATITVTVGNKKATCKITVK